MYQIYFLLDKLDREFETFEAAFRFFHPMVMAEIKEGTPTALVATTSWIQMSDGFLDGDITNQWGNTIIKAQNEGLLIGDKLTPAPEKTIEMPDTETEPRSNVRGTIIRFHLPQTGAARA